MKQASNPGTYDTMVLVGCSRSHCFADVLPSYSRGRFQRWSCNEDASTARCPCLETSLADSDIDVSGHAHLKHISGGHRPVHFAFHRHLELAVPHLQSLDRPPHSRNHTHPELSAAVRTQGPHPRHHRRLRNLQAHLHGPAATPPCATLDHPHVFASTKPPDK